MVSIYQNIFSKDAHYIEVEKALERIRVGKSAQKIIEIREQLDKERANKLKCNLPSVCFSGKFSERKDNALIEHSGFICLDFDNLQDVEQEKNKLKSDPFVYSCWVSPSGNGLKALIQIADGGKHRQHFESLQEHFTNVDPSGVNESRVCYESWDSEIYVNTKAKVWSKTKEVKKVQESQKIESGSEVFDRILKWLSNKGDAFVTGERNTFIFKLGSACCRFGISEHECFSLCRIAFVRGEKSFTESELQRTIKSAYHSNRGSFGTAEFSNDVLVDKVSRSEIKTKEIDPDIYNVDIKPKDVIFGEDVKQEALSLYDNGYDRVDGVGIPDLDEHFKMKYGEISLMTGIGNYGKSSFLAWYLILRVVKFGDKFALFSPENNPAQEFYHDLVEIYLGASCTPDNPYRPSKQEYERVYDLLSKNIFYVYPKEIAPTPEYIKERFLELIIKEKITGCIIDPFNQMSNDYGKQGGRTDKYLESFLADCSRFAQINQVYFFIVAHPKLMKKEKGDMNYPEPDVFDIADGAMWNNKLDNILVYHRPHMGDNPMNPLATLSTKKIRRQKVVGKRGTVTFEYSRSTRRFWFSGIDALGLAIGEKQPLVYTHEPNTEISDMRKFKNKDFDVINGDPVNVDLLPF
jgi:hypothetical protein